MNKSDRLIELVNRYNFTEEECSTILRLMDLLDCRLFVKIIDVVMSNDSKTRLIFDDFTSLLGEKYTEEITNLIINQERLRELERDLENILYTYGIDVLSDFKIKDSDLVKTVESEKRKELILEILQGEKTGTTADEKLIATIKRKFIIDQNITDSDLNDILISLNDYIVPLSYENQYITHKDRVFMADNGIDELTMKKIKALKYLSLVQGE